MSAERVHEIAMECTKTYFLISNQGKFEHEAFAKDFINKYMKTYEMVSNELNKANEVSFLDRSKLGL
ncbi:hypothetical protein CDFC105_72923 [Clostridioides difficile]|nr:hypothetical protein CDFC105_64143 [Clostridioides difficile]CZS08824.1 hypothetical protein CDFC105_72923 [Clostridioides difficile]